MPEGHDNDDDDDDDVDVDDHAKIGLATHLSSLEKS